MKKKTTEKTPVWGQINNKEETMTTGYYETH